MIAKTYDNARADVSHTGRIFTVIQNDVVTTTILQSEIETKVIKH